MPIIADTLEDANCKKAKSNGVKEQLLFDGGCPGLHLHVSIKTNRKTWRVRLNIEGKIKTKKIGVYPKMGLSKARLEAGLILENGLPDLQVLAKNSFEEVAEAWFTFYKNKPVKGKKTPPEPKTYNKYRGYLDLDLIPFFKDKKIFDIDDIDSEICEEILQRVDKRTNTGAVKCHQCLNMIFKYAVKKGKKKYLVDLDDIVYMKNPKKFIPPKDIHAEYAKCLNMTSKLMQLAMRLQHHIFLRSGEIMSLEWEHVKNSMLEIPAELMKMDQPHKVPLSTHAKKIIEEIKKFTGSEKFLFPSSSKTGHLTGDALSKAFREHQIPYYPHRCRTIAGSWFKNKSIAAPYIVEIQLSHKTKSKVQESYEVEAHDFFLKERKIMMQKWSDFLESPTQEKPELETIEINSDPYIISEKLIKFV